MTREVVCPHCGLRLPLDPLDEPLPALDAARTIETVLPRTVVTEELPARAQRSASDGGGPAPAAAETPNGHSSPPAGRRAIPPLEFPPLTTPDPDLEPPTLPEAFPAIELESRSAIASVASEPAVAEYDEEDEEEPEPPHSPWLVVLLGSYASAMTLVCLWLWWGGRRPEPSRVATIPADSRPDLQGVPPEPPPAAATLRSEHITRIGQALRVGSLEFTPLEIHVGQVELEHLGVEGEQEWRDGGPGALILRVRLTNMSSTATFTPLEASFVRVPDRGRPESFLDSPSGERIDTYSLPQASEWSIVGQTFPELKPGESAETVLVSQSESAGGIDPSMTWRVRVRTGPDAGATELVGVRIRHDEVH